MEKDIERIPKNPDTDIIIRIDDFGGKIGLTIREFVKGERYTGFTKAGTRIPAEHFKKFKDAINSISESDLTNEHNQSIGTSGQKEDSSKKPQNKQSQSKFNTDIEDQEF